MIDHITLSILRVLWRESGIYEAVVTDCRILFVLTIMLHLYRSLEKKFSFYWWTTIKLNKMVTFVSTYRIKVTNEDIKFRACVVFGIFQGFSPYTGKRMDMTAYLSEQKQKNLNLWMQTCSLIYFSHTWFIKRRERE